MKKMEPEIQAYYDKLTEYEKEVFVVFQNMEQFKMTDEEVVECFEDPGIRGGIKTMEERVRHPGQAGFLLW